MGELLSRRRVLFASAFLLSGACKSVSPAPTAAPKKEVSSRRVVIIGAGISGLAIALELEKRGWDPLVLEAANRVGGRVLTIREPFRDGRYVEAGAAHIVPDPDLSALLEEMQLGLLKRPRPPERPATIELRAGKRYVSPPDPEPPSTYEYTADELTLGGEGRRKKYFSLVDGVDPTAPLPKALLRYDDMSAAAFLEEVGASSAAAKSFHDAFQPHDSLGNVSALALIREVANFSREIGLKGKGGRIAGGSDRLPTKMAEKLGARVELGAKVKRVERSERSVRVVFERNGKTESVEAARVVCALPSTVMRDIAFEPALSAEKQRAIADLGMVSVSRVYLGCERAIWTEQKHGAAADTDDWLGRLTDETNWAEGATGVLGVYAVGDTARRLGRMSEPERITAVKDLAERVHPGVGPLVYGGTSKCWDDDPLQRGAYASFRPKELTTLAVSLARAEGPIHFAGDQTSYRPGFMHGALGSAKRVVLEVAGPA